ncbi:flagellar basal body rod protein FlgB [Burkholderia sp. Ac-20379]|uniref:flagellar basal body rod protein FlgB n=1 Tax=Burkholderia sp. Ac-20379 TaxID=2703900 RepID=UPI00197D72FA|nr:flagellar basal body rod protein FlgB [Burkholderia sp. Ac-20379]MBN3727288.1 flagellar basal body rod protein FlgB [Burkholderia sp. Ac-20379]
MGFNLDHALGVHPAALKVRAERTRILASNIANESVPHYQARDLDFRAALDAERSNAAFGAGLAFDGDTARYRLPSGPSQDGNTVELGVEQAEFSQNSADFQASLTFLNLKLKGLHAAITGNG